MSKNYYSLYLDDVIALAKTLTIKSEQSALSINTFLKTKYGNSIVNENDKTTWKYYLNICGEYHSTDEVIYITSLDTLEQIPFNKESLLSNKTTAREYVFGTRYYQELVSLYPEHEQIILGVLYPADMQKAINANDGAILSYPSIYVDENEASLIYKLEVWIKKYLHRWNNNQFTLSDSLYSAACHAVMYLNLIPTILNIRLRACKTPQAHSYHIREYLASHGLLDIYLDNLTKKQALFLYRNINYIERNNGKKEIFEWLIQNILTERGLPIAEYTMRHDVQGMPEVLYPVINFRKKLLNLQTSIQSNEDYTLEELLNKEIDEAPGNKEYINTHYNKIHNEFIRSLSGVVATKVLESSVIENSDSYGQSLESILFNEWLHLSHLGIYHVYVRAKNPINGNDIILNTKDAFIYSLFCYCKAMGLNVVTIPSLLAHRVQKLPIPDNSFLNAVNDTSVMPASMANTLIGYQPNIDNIDSTDAFYIKCKEIYIATKRQAGLAAIQSNRMERALVENMTCRLYEDVLCEVVPTNTSIDSWLLSKELPIKELTTEEYYSLYTTITADATGMSLHNEQSIANIQKAMIGIMKQLSSYSVQFLTEVNGANLIPLKWSSIRVGNINTQTNEHNYISGLDVGIINLRTSSNINEKFNYFGSNFDQKLTINKSDKFDYKATVHAKFNNKATKVVKFNIGSMTINGSFIDNEQGVNKTFSGYETFDSLSIEDKLKVPDIYCKCIETQLVRKISLSDTILNNEIGSFNYIGITNNVINGFTYQSLPYFSGGSFTSTITDDDLNAFYAMFGSTDVEGFKSTGEISTLSEFIYTPPV